MGDFNDAFMRNNPNVQARAKAQNRANVMQLKLIGQSHPTGLTANLLKLFEPRPPLEYKPPPEKRKCPSYTGMAQFVSNFAQPGDPEYAPPVPEVETPAQRRARIHKLRLEEGAKKAAEELEKYDPSSDPNVTGDPYKTLFVARLNYETTESRVKREFEAFGPIKRVRLVMDKNTNKPRGYAFIEFVHTRDMKAAYKQADGKKIDNKRVLVDVERGRTVPNWRPRRLGGGLGTTRVGTEDVNREVVVQVGRAASRSEEPRVRDDRDRDREKSRERGRDREREKSRERSHDRLRERDHRDDRHHRERDRTKERERDRGRDRDRDRDRTRDRERGKDKDRDHERDRDRDRDRERDRHREKDRERGRDHEGEEVDHGRGRSRDKDYDYEHVDSKPEQERHVDSGRNYDNVEPEDDRGHYDYYDHHQGRGDYENPDAQGGDDRYKEPSRDHDRYDQMEEDNYAYGPAASEATEKDRDYRRSDRSLSREYDY